MHGKKEKSLKKGKKGIRSSGLALGKGGHCKNREKVSSRRREKVWVTGDDGLSSRGIRQLKEHWRQSPREEGRIERKKEEMPTIELSWRGESSGKKKRLARRIKKKLRNFGRE